MYTRERVAQHVAPPPCINSVNCQFASFDVRPGKRNPIRNRHRGLLFRRISRSKIRISSQTRPFPFSLFFYYRVSSSLASFRFRAALGERGNLFEFLFQIISSLIITFSAFFSYSSPVGLGSRSEFNSSRRPRKLKFLQKSFEQLRLLN